MGVTRKSYGKGANDLQSEGCSYEHLIDVTLSPCLPPFHTLIQRILSRLITSPQVLSLYQKFTHLELKGSMRGNGGRGEGGSEARQNNLSTASKGFLFASSSSQLDRKDLEILSHARDCPTTLLSVSERTEISFVECLHRANRLQRMGFLRKLEDPSRFGGLFLYIAVEREV